jgi:hypothetical protein
MNSHNLIAKNVYRISDVRRKAWRKGPSWCLVWILRENIENAYGYVVFPIIIRSNSGIDSVKKLNFKLQGLIQISSYKGWSKFQVTRVEQNWKCLRLYGLSLVEFLYVYLSTNLE